MMVKDATKFHNATCGVGVCINVCVCVCVQGFIEDFDFSEGGSPKFDVDVDST